MPELDKLIEKMAQRNVQRVEIVNDRAMKLFSGANQAVGPVVTMQHLRQTISEVIPADCNLQLEQMQQCQFPYPTSDGNYNVTVECGSNSLRVSVSAPPDSQWPQAHLPGSGGRNLPSMQPNPSDTTQTSVQASAQIKLSHEEIAKKSRLLIWGGVGLLTFLFIALLGNAWHHNSVRNDLQDYHAALHDECIGFGQGAMIDYKTAMRFNGKDDVLGIQYDALDVIENTVIPNHRKFIEKLQAIKPRTARVRTLHQTLLKIAMKEQLGFEDLIIRGKQDGFKSLDAAEKEMIAWQKEWDTTAKSYGLSMTVMNGIINPWRELTWTIERDQATGKLTVSPRN